MSTTADIDPATEGLIEDRRARRLARLAGRDLWAVGSPGTELEFAL